MINCGFFYTAHELYVERNIISDIEDYYKVTRAFHYLSTYDLKRVLCTSTFLFLPVGQLFFAFSIFRNVIRVRVVRVFRETAARYYIARVLFCSSIPEKSIK